MNRQITLLYCSVLVITFALTLVHQSTHLLDTRNTRVNDVKETDFSLEALHTRNAENSKFVPVIYPHHLGTQDKFQKHHPTGTSFDSEESKIYINGINNFKCFNQCGKLVGESCDQAIHCTCCTNRIVTSHKMGTALSYTWKKFLNHSVSFYASRNRGHSASRLKELQEIALNENRKELYSTQSQWTKQFREVLIVRNLYSTLVSGYTYHKSGRECWLDAFGVPDDIWLKNAARFMGMYKQEPHQMLFQGKLNISSIFESKDALWKMLKSHENICSVLNETTDYEGMTIYIDYAYRTYYEALATYYQNIQHLNFTKIVHYEDIIDAPLEVFYSVHNWFSGADTSQTKIKAGRIPPIIYSSDYDNNLHQQLLVKNSDTHGHSANQNKSKKEMLYSLAIEIDHEHYDGTFAKMNKLFGYENTEMQ